MDDFQKNNCTRQSIQFFPHKTSTHYENKTGAGRRNSFLNINTRHSRYRFLYLSCTPVFLFSKSYPNSTIYYNKPVLLSFDITTLNAFECTTLLDILNQFLKLSLITFLVKEFNLLNDFSWEKSMKRHTHTDFNVMVLCVVFSVWLVPVQHLPPQRSEDRAKSWLETPSNILPLCDSSSIINCCGINSLWDCCQKN